MIGMEKVRPGQKLRIPASSYNAFVDAAQWVKAHERNTGRSLTEGEWDVVRCRNTGSGDIPRFHLACPNSMDVADYRDGGFDVTLPTGTYANDIPAYMVCKDSLVEDGGGVGRFWLWGAHPVATDDTSWPSFPTWGSAKSDGTIEYDPAGPLPVLGDITETVTGAQGYVMVNLSGQRRVVTETIIFCFMGCGSPLEVGLYGPLVVDYAGIITAVTLLSDVAGYVTVDIHSTTVGAYPIGSSITASAQPEISGGQTDSDTTLTGWTTGITPGTVLMFYIDSIGTTSATGNDITWLMCGLKVKRA
jgi:hypothetical protein